MNTQEETMKVVVFGAAGKTGRAVVDQAKAAGHTVTAFVHNADDYDVPDVEVREGDATDPAAVDAALAGQDAVIDTIGGKTPYKATTLESSVARAILNDDPAAGEIRVYTPDRGTRRTRSPGRTWPRSWSPS